MQQRTAMGLIGRIGLIGLRFVWSYKSHKSSTSYQVNRPRTASPAIDLARCTALVTVATMMSRSISLILAATLSLAGYTMAPGQDAQPAGTPPSADIGSLKAENAKLKKEVSDAAKTIADLQAKLAQSKRPARCRHRRRGRRQFRRGRRQFRRGRREVPACSHGPGRRRQRRVRRHALRPAEGPPARLHQRCHHAGRPGSRRRQDLHRRQGRQPLENRA